MNIKNGFPKQLTRVS